MTTAKQISANFTSTAQSEFCRLFAFLFRAFSASRKPASTKKLREIGPENSSFSQHTITASDRSFLALIGVTRTFLRTLQYSAPLLDVTSYFLFFCAQWKREGISKRSVHSIKLSSDQKLLDVKFCPYRPKLL